MRSIFHVAEMLISEVLCREVLLAQPHHGIDAVSSCLVCLCYKSVQAIVNFRLEGLSEETILFNSLLQLGDCVEPERTWEMSDLANKALPASTSGGVVVRAVLGYSLEDKLNECVFRDYLA